MRLRIIVVLSVFFNCYSDHLDLHSFPTRRSSDLILVTAFLLGLDPRAVVMTGVLQFFMTLFPHWNVRTRKWVGYFIRRPEEHILHHQRGVHAANYSDWPFWDKVFGTYREPVEGPVQISFDQAGFIDQLKMLAFVDVNASDYVNGARIGASPSASGAAS